MFYIKLITNSEEKYLYNYRCAVYNRGYAKRFKTAAAAKRYMRGKQVAEECLWWVVER